MSGLWRIIEALTVEYAQETMVTHVALLDRTKDAASTGKFEPFKTPPNFDGPVGRELHGLS